MMIHTTSSNPKEQDGIPKVASRGRIRGSCLCEALKNNHFFGELLLDGNKS
jgi:hypothetical protein